jgi:hypothetical protein
VRKLKGPDLKDLKVPPVLRDLFQDLRDRRLLPLLALVVVAIVAVPFLLGGSSEEEGGSGSPSLTTPPVESAEAARLTVVEAKPGLRDYRKRLRARVATDPFKQRYTKPVVKGAELPAETSTSGGSESASATTTTESSTGAVVVESPTEGGGADAGPGHGGGGGGNGKAPPLTIFTFAANIQYAHTEEKADGSIEMAQPTLREKVMPYTPLPGQKAPVVTYLGIGAGAETALLMVSRDVTAVFGDGKCVSGTDSCELLEVDLGLPETFEYGPNHVRYKINVLKIVPVAAGHS